MTSLKDPAIEPALARLIAARAPKIIINTTAFSALREDDTTVLDSAGVPVLQAVLAGSARDAWAVSPRGLSATDVAMNVVLPELDGRLLSRAISFKAEAAVDPRLEFATVRHQPEMDRIAYVATLAAGWVRLGSRPRAERQVAIMLSDYPARGGRAGYAVGLDSAASAAAILADLAAAGFDTGPHAISTADVEALLNGHAKQLTIPLAAYARQLAVLPASIQADIEKAWGDPAIDPAFADGHFHFPVLRAGRIAILLQPDRGSHADRKATYHDMTIPPRHAYVALYGWLRDHESIDALVHLGTHGTLEWLPGKALALSSECWPEAVLGPMPVIYPFIVNNPGEAAQAKRRLCAVTIGHLTPPLTAGGLHGAMAELEALVEEYAAADGLDRRRMPLLEAEIIDRAWSTGLAAECGLVRGELPRQSIAKLDARLCDIKDLSVRDGLHVFGRTPEATGTIRARSSHRDREWSVFRGGSASHDRKRRRGVCNERARGFAGRARRPSRSGGAIRRSQPWPRRCPPYWTQPDIARSARRADPGRLLPSAFARQTKSFAAICRITAIILARL